MKNIAIILAGGKGSRMKSSMPKQYMKLNGKTVLYYSIEAFQQCELIDEIILVAGESYITYCEQEYMSYFNKIKKVVVGGKERYESVLCGLRTISDSEKGLVFIHDGARPCVTQDIIRRCYKDALSYHASVAAVPAKDTIKVCDAEGFAVTTPDRNTLWQVQTPQTFDIKLVKSAYEKMAADSLRGVITDDAMVVEKYSNTLVKLTNAGYTNIKITTPDDLYMAQYILADKKANI
jgi:2-C-methyl-D-erythritol 4-phosphate cytidylyltransferase